VKWIDAGRVPAVLATATLISVVALGWFGIRTLQQDRELERQRQRERLEVAAARVALGLERRVQQIEEQLAKGSGSRFVSTGIESSGDLRVLFQPEVTPAPPVASPDLTAAESEEYQRHDLDAAESAYRRIAATGPVSARAAALVALGRVQRLRNDYSRAMEAYDELEQLGPVIVAGQPAALVARQGRCKTLEAAGDRDRLREEVRRLSIELESGRWRIDRATFDLYDGLVRQWGGAALGSSSIVRTEAAVELWHAWRRGDLGPRGRRVLVRDPVPVMAVWVADADRVTMWIETAAAIEEQWKSLWQGQGLSVALADVDGRRFVGTPRERSVLLAPSETRLPFMLYASSLASGETMEPTRRRVLMSGLLLALALMIAAAYAVFRTTTRELALARQQTDFVSAVSHEFRTPLTSMRHLTELLVSRAVTSEERKAQYYELLARETERLHRMVESLLSFGRMDVDAYSWNLESADVSRLVNDMVDEFRHEPIAAGRQVQCEIDKELPPIRADREALSRALWNLLENAGKYSEAGTPIRVFATRQDDSVLIGVTDQGIGIPAAEQRRIFQKFVRGSDAKRSGARGVGIGLALVTRIAEAHGGQVRLDSAPGRGSTFTLVIPCLES
jgi:signal transduction histidine kinase